MPAPVRSIARRRIDDLAASRDDTGHPGSLATHDGDLALLRWLQAEVTLGGRALEVGAGATTVILAALVADHVVVDPDHRRGAVEAWAAAHDVDLGAIDWASDFDAIPGRGDADPSARFDVVVIDPDPAFPAAIVAWERVAPLVAADGLLVVNRVDVRANAVLDDFLRHDPAWRERHRVGRATVFGRADSSIPVDRPADAQPWNRVRPRIDARLKALKTRLGHVRR